MTVVTRFILARTRRVRGLDNFPSGASRKRSDTCSSCSATKLLNTLMHLVRRAETIKWLDGKGHIKVKDQRLSNEARLAHIVGELAQIETAVERRLSFRVKPRVKQCEILNVDFEDIELQS